MAYISCASLHYKLGLSICMANISCACLHCKLGLSICCQLLVKQHKRVCEAAHQQAAQHSRAT